MAANHPLTLAFILESGDQVVILEGVAAAVTGAGRLQAFLDAYNPKHDWNAPPPLWMARLFGPDAGRLKPHLAPAGRLDWLVGGTPSQLPDRYAQLSPVHRVHPGCPPTLLVHGEHDEMAPVAAARRLQRRLEQAGVPATGVYLPHTDHAFDLLATAWSPPARVAIHVLERFLAVLATTHRTSAAQPISGASAERAALPASTLAVR